MRLADDYISEEVWGGIKRDNGGESAKECERGRERAREGERGAMCLRGS